MNAKRHYAHAIATAALLVPACDTTSGPTAAAAIPSAQSVPASSPPAAETDASTGNATTDAASFDANTGDGAPSETECLASPKGGPCLPGCTEQLGYVRGELDGGVGDEGGVTDAGSDTECMAPVHLFCGTRANADNAGVDCWVRLSDGGIFKIPSRPVREPQSMASMFRMCTTPERDQMVQTSRYCP